jgi:hypothetical protein
VSDLTGNLEPRRRWKATTTPAQSQLNRARQAELVICDKAIDIALRLRCTSCGDKRIETYPDRTGRGTR